MLVLLVTMYLALCFLSGVVWPKMLGILAGIDQEGPLQWHFQGWFCWLQYTSRCVSFPVFRLVMLGIMAGMDQKVLFGMCKAWFAGF